ncbi:MAG: zinc-dependent metalloprotease [Casimicrobiaceae bacterium]|nr:zinc-dependent metalloprotease [Casimicrobiaceae bacterium]MDW8311779.1 zinc-dependent metalloprotease [Burkholderiales bacterium]
MLKPIASLAVRNGRVQRGSSRAGAARQWLLAPAVLAALAGCAHAPSAPSPAPDAQAAQANPAAATAAAPAAASPASAAAATRPTAATPPAPAPAPAAASAAAQAPRPFAEVIKDAKEEPGFFTTWKKDDKVWIEIPESMWDRPFVFSVNVTHAIGDGGLFGNHMGAYLAAGRGLYLASFRKHGSNGVQLIARNTAHTAQPGSPAARMVERAFSDSLIATATIVSAPHPERKSVLIEANALLLNDFPSAAAMLEQVFRQPYQFDARNSSLERAKNDPNETGFYVRAHYQLPKVVIPTPGAPTQPGTPTPRVPRTLPDVRSLFFGFYYGFSKLPAEPMRPRVSDPRVGYFSTPVADYTDPDRRDPRTRYIHRWRLEKKDPNAPLSEPKEPIVFWLDRNIPTKYREVIKAGILEWNKAFERIGFKDAIVVKQQGDEADFDTSATRYASVRWVAARGLGFGARGPSKVDPRTGEILDADIEINEEITRIYTARATEDPPRPIGQALWLSRWFGHPAICTYAQDKLDETAFALDLLVARGQFEYGSPEAERFVLDALKDITIHEVGHTLGLRHNFKASLGVTPEQLRDPKFGAEVGISASVMDYNALNIALKDERQGQYSMITIGPYDYWAIEYGYQQTTPETEKAALEKTLARATEPALQYATDEDAGFGSLSEGIDPEANRFDLGNDPLGFYEKRFAVVRELWERLQTRELRPGTPYEQLRRNFERGFNQIGIMSELAAKYVGGVRVLRDPAGTGRQPLTPVSAEEQRRALRLLTKNLFEVDAFRFKPEFLGRLSIDFEARFDVIDEELGPGTLPPVDYSVTSRVLGLQRAVLAQLLRDSVAARLIAAPERLASPQAALPLAELYETLQRAIWSELASAQPISPMRRNLQREHARLLAQTIAAANPRTPADARSLQRHFATELLASLRRAVAKRGLPIETRAHLEETIALLEAALKAQLNKALG